ncbi:MAG: beta-ketoacyl synthase chain length factor [Sandaracinaceae bacterium]|nr:beta-ketoacyl synthase chain length factor [Sandaracinaceae bacterium]
MTAVHVLGRGFFTPSFPNLAAFRAGVPDAEAQRPAVDFVQSRNKRGCSILTLAAAEVAHQACLDAGLSPAQPALVFGSCHGEMEIAVAQMEMFQEDKGLLSPARFKNSVHNTGAGMFSIAMDNRGYATAIAGGHDTVALSLLEAILLLQHDRYETAVVALADERLPAPLTHFSPHEALGVAVLLGRAPHPERGSLGTLSIPQRSPEALFAADTRFSGNPIAPLLDVIDALDSGRAGRVPLSLPGGEPWWCEVQSNAEARART